MVSRNNKISLSLEQFTSFVNNINKLNNDSTEVLSELIEQFPYFQTARLLYLKSLHNEKNINFDKQLKLTATYVNDRRILYKLINDKEFVQEIFEETDTDKKEQIVVPEQNIAVETDVVHKRQTPVKQKQDYNKDKKGVAAENKKAKQVFVNKTLAEDVINKVTEIKKDKQKKDSGESIADIILKKAGKSKKHTGKEENNIAKTETNNLDSIKKEQKSEHNIVESKLTEKEELLQFDHDNQDIQRKSYNPAQDNELPVETYCIDSYFDLDNETHDAGVGIKEDSAESNFSFTQWLDKVNKKTDKQKVQPKQETSKEALLISKFIASDPSIKPLRDELDYQVQIEEQETDNDDEFITETLAKIYIKQKLYDKAIKAYKKLSLKYPEKNIYFANQINNVKELIKKK